MLSSVNMLLRLEKVYMVSYLIHERNILKHMKETEYRILFLFEHFCFSTAILDSYKTDGLA